MTYRLKLGVRGSWYLPDSSRGWGRRRNKRSLVSLGYRDPVYKETERETNTCYKYITRAGFCACVRMMVTVAISHGAKGSVLCFRYTGHCPLLRYSMGQTYGQVTGQLLRGPPGLAWPPAHRKLLPPIESPRSPGISRGRLPPRHGHERLSSSIVPGYTGLYGGLNGCPLPIGCVPNTHTSFSLLGFIPQAQFMFAKNCNQVWAEAMNNFTQRHGQQESHELSKEAKEGKEAEKDQGPEVEEPELKQEVAQVSWGRLVMGEGHGDWLPALSPGSLNVQS